MRKFITHQHGVSAEKILQVGASPGYYQLENGSIAVLPVGFSGFRAGDYVIFDGSKPTHVLKAENFESQYKEMPDHLDVVAIEDNIASQDFVESGSITICVITLKDGRKVSGVDNSIDGTQEERQELAYHDTFKTLLSFEVFALQGLHALCKGVDDE